MGEKAEYRSAKRSRRMIQQAYVELMQEKEIDKITVTDIVTRADLNRGTFYAHYKNTEELLTQIKNEIINKMLEFLQEFHHNNFFQTPLPLLQKVGSYIEDNYDFLHMLLGTKGSSQFLLKLNRTFVEFLKNNEEIPQSIKDKPDFIIQGHFFAGGIINTYQAWLRGDLDKPLQEVSLSISNLITSSCIVNDEE